MKVAPEIQKKLIDLSFLDNEIAALNLKIQNHPIKARFLELQNRVPGIEATKVENMSNIEEIKKQINKIELDADNIKKRIENDTKRLNSSETNPKQLTQIQHEIETMNLKLSEIENKELEQLSQLEEMLDKQKNLEVILDQINHDLKLQKDNLNKDLLEIENNLLDLNKSRTELITVFIPELIKLYEKIKQDHGIGAGILDKNKCGACQITISPAEFEQIKKTDPSEILRCENCRCILVRI